MSSFKLKILKPQGVIKDCEAKKVVIRTTEGDVGILKGHANYLAAIKEGPITIFFGEEGENNKEEAKVREGFVSVINGQVIIMVFGYEKLEERS